LHLFFSRLFDAAVAGSSGGRLIQQPLLNEANTDDPNATNWIIHTIPTDSGTYAIGNNEILAHCRKYRLWYLWYLAAIGQNGNVA